MTTVFVQAIKRDQHARVLQRSAAVKAAAKLVGRSWNASYSGQICIRKSDAKASIFQVVPPCRVTKPARLTSESPAAEVPVIPGLEGAMSGVLKL